MNKNKTDRKLVDYIFWITLILFTNPGGILQVMGEDAGDGGINVTDILFVILCACYLIVIRKNERSDDIAYKKIMFYFIIFLLYYFVIFAFFTPIFKNNPSYSGFMTIVKIRYAIINFSLIFLIYKFALRSYTLFLKIFLYSSISIIILFILTIYSGVEILPVGDGGQRFTGANRLFMINYGILFILIPMGVVAIVFQFSIKLRKAILIGFVLMFMVWLFSILRRHIFGTLIYFILASVLYNFIQKKGLIPFKKMFSIGFYLIIIFFIVQFSFPKYAEVGIAAVEDVIHTVKYGQSSSGQKDARVGLGKEFMQNLILESPFFGTGFDNRWRTKEGDTSGFEAADYPLLSAIGMTGLVGLLFFLPIYVVIVKMLIYDIKYLRQNNYDKNSMESYLMILFILYFSYRILQYFNWFFPVASFSSDLSKRWFIYLGLYLASRKLFYLKEDLKDQEIRSF